MSFYLLCSGLVFISLGKARSCTLYRRARCTKRCVSWTCIILLFPIFRQTLHQELAYVNESISASTGFHTHSENASNTNTTNCFNPCCIRVRLVCVCLDSRLRLCLLHLPCEQTPVEPSYL